MCVWGVRGCGVCYVLCVCVGVVCVWGMCYFHILSLFHIQVLLSQNGTMWFYSDRYMPYIHYLSNLIYIGT